MHFSLEARLPFLDINLVEKALALPNHMKIKNGETKVKLREIAKGKVAPEIIENKNISVTVLFFSYQHSHPESIDDNKT